jgi:hypothetical protein
MRHAHLISAVALVAAAVLGSCRPEGQVAQNDTNTSTSTSARHAELTLPSGTSMDVTLATQLSSETAGVGDSWTGTIQNASIVDGRNVIPAGSSVSGTVSSVRPARKGDRAMLDLEMTSVTVGGRNYRVRAGTEAVIAGSTRARNLGAIAGGVAAGALIGKAVSHSNKGTIIGGLIGGGAATGAVSQTKGWQVVLKQGTLLTFTTDQAVAVRL